jgi:hypothetical protein
MPTKEEFQQLAYQEIDKYPTISSLYQVGDPRIIQHIDAIAAMLSVAASTVAVSQGEVFDKARDATVLADAAMRGIIRKARSGKVRVSALNKNTGSITLDAGRSLTDSVGNLYRIDTPITIAAESTAQFDATQIRVEEITHTVTGSIPFYAIEITESDDGSYLSGINVSDSVGDYQYKDCYTNIVSGDRVFHVETDEKQRVYVRFGQAGIVGVQPANGTVITLKISRSMGVISPESGSPFEFEYILNSNEVSVELSLHSVLDGGANPIDISTLRELARYPSVYKKNAVYLGEFDALVRTYYPDTQFLSVWNENIEEQARGANEDNINSLFVACVSAIGDESVLTEATPSSPVAPTLITSLTATQTGIKNVILSADDSYRVKFYTPVKSKIIASITAVVSTTYIATEVRGQIIDLILKTYGITSPAARHGHTKPLYQLIYKLLRENITALSDGAADMQVSITPYTGPYRPELWRYIATDSLTVTVTTENVTVSGWG